MARRAAPVPQPRRGCSHIVRGCAVVAGLPEWPGRPGALLLGGDIRFVEAPDAVRQLSGGEPHRAVLSINAPDTQHVPLGRVRRMGHLDPVAHRPPRDAPDIDAADVHSRSFEAHVDEMPAVRVGVSHKRIMTPRRRTYRTAEPEECTRSGQMRTSHGSLVLAYSASGPVSGVPYWADSDFVPGVA